MSEMPIRESVVALECPRELTIARTGVQIVDQRRGAPGRRGRVVERHQLRLPARGQNLTADGVPRGAPVGDAVELFPQKQRLLGIGGAIVLVKNVLGHKVRHLGRAAGWDAAHIDLGQQTDVATARAVGRLAPQRVAVAVPRSARTGIVLVRGQRVVDTEAIGIGVDGAHRDHADVAAQEQPASAPVGIGIGDELADLVGLESGRAHRIAGVAFRARVICIDIVRGDDSGRQAVGNLLVD